MPLKKYIYLVIRFTLALLIVVTLSRDIFSNSKFSFGPAQTVITFLGVILFLISYLDINGLIKGTDIHKNKSFALIDVIIILIFGLFSYIYFYGRWRGIIPNIKLVGDSAMLASIAASIDHPLNFTKDYLFSNPIYIKSYIALHIPIIRFLVSIVKDYGLATILILFPTVLLHLTGYYFLGKYFLNDRVKGLIFTLIVSINFVYNPWDYWGISTDPQPRFLYQAILPFLLLIAYHYKDNPPRWPFVLLFAGILFYSHSISGLGVGFMLLFGYLLRGNPKITIAIKVKYLIISTIVFFGSITPFIIMYLNNFIHSSPVDYSPAASFVYDYFSMWLDIPQIINVYVGQLWMKGILPYALICFPLLLIFKFILKDINLIIYWFLGLILFSIIIPWVEHTIEIQLKIMPYQMDLVRNLRYTVPIIILVICLVVDKMTYRLKENNKSLFIYFSIIMFIPLSIQSQNGIFDTNNLFKTGYTCILAQTNFCASEKVSDQINILNYLKNKTNKEESIFVLSKSFPTDAVRYYSIRSIAYNKTETISAIAYIDVKLAMNNDNYQKYFIEPHQLGPDSLPITKKILPFCKYSPDYIVDDIVNRDDISKDLTVVTSNRDYVVYYVKDFCLANYKSYFYTR